MSLIPVTHDADADQVGHICTGVATLEMIPELPIRIELDTVPLIQRCATFHDDRILRTERIALPAARGALGSDSAPHVLDRVPAHESFPSDVDDGGGVTFRICALVAALRQLQRTPLPFQHCDGTPSVIRYAEAEHGGLRADRVSGVNVWRGLSDQRVIIRGPRFSIDHAKCREIDDLFTGKSGRRGNVTYPTAGGPHEN